MNDTQTIDKFDRAYGALHDVSLRTKPTTIEYIEPITGRVQTFVVQTFRHPENGDYTFIKTMDDTGLVRVYLPPKVTSTVASQKAALTKMSLSRRGKRVMAERMASGWKPTPPKRKRKVKA